MHLLGNLSVENSAQIGSVGSPIGEFASTGTCSYGGSVTSCGPPSHVYASTIGTSPPAISKPTVNLSYWYTNAQLGPQSACSTGSFPGGFDNDSTLNVSRGEIDLTPASAYDCRKIVGGQTVAQIAWQPGSPGTLTIKGVIYFDAHLSWSNLNLIQYDGKGGHLRLGAGARSRTARTSAAFRPATRRGIRASISSSSSQARSSRRSRPIRSAATSATT